MIAAALGRCAEVLGPRGGAPNSAPGWSSEGVGAGLEANFDNIEDVVRELVEDQATTADNPGT